MKTLTSRQEAKLNMYDVVIVKCDENTFAVNTIAALGAAVTEFKSIVAQIHAAAPESAAVITGFAADKTNQKESVSRTAAVIAGQIFAYAAKTKNVVLKQAVDFSESDLNRIKDGEFAARIQTIHDLGVEHKTALADYGITDANLADLQAAISDYAASVPKPRAAIADRSTVKSNIKQMFKDADEILVEQMDNLVETLTPTAPDFVHTYKSARVIIDPKTGNPEDSGSNTNNGTNPPA